MAANGSMCRARLTVSNRSESHVLYPAIAGTEIRISTRLMMSMNRKRDTCDSAGTRGFQVSAGQGCLLFHHFLQAMGSLLHLTFRLSTNEGRTLRRLQRLFGREVQRAGSLGEPVLSSRSDGWQPSPAPLSPWKYS